ncbi:glycerol-3-phosphate dehydrogenase [Kordiimonas pumila]|uniref:Glycerol-3-phosphate dehydrogenase n=1 Tax=Kordiimonas pumila TaxID=2161677 RepID=A0ABV7D6W8_9PROT|nr:glycerol-3-phosphate dehydrogenase [Kordiimonas pumila]
MAQVADIFIIGGGINGVGIARDAAGRGLKVILAEKDDLASHTSSSSSKLIHGGLRYLEHYEFRLVRESLMEREILLNAAPHLIRPLRFVLPHHKGLRPAFILRLGLFLYDYIGGRKILPPTKTLALTKHPHGKPLKPTLTKGFEYSDCWVDDARLVAMSAVDAARHGATILTRTKVLGAKRQKGLWNITVREPNGEMHVIKASALVNAAGPWVDKIEDKASPPPQSSKQIKMVKGSHIVVPRLYHGEQAFTFQHTDGRVIFTIPYENNYTLIGTTDVAFSGDPDQVSIDKHEKEYLCSVVSEYLEAPVIPESIIWSYAGVRPLVDDGAENASKTTRDYVLELDTQEGAPMLSVYGGKITTFRCLAEEALEKLQAFLQYGGQPWTASAPLPGGEMGYENIVFYIGAIKTAYPWLPDSLCHRYIRSYGTLTETLLSRKTSLEDMGQAFGASLYEAELVYLKQHEWATTAEDALWRRSKLGLHMTEEEQHSVAQWFESQP